MIDDARKQAWLGAAGFFLGGAAQFLVAATRHSWWSVLCGTLLMAFGIVLVVLDRRPSRRTTGMSRQTLRMVVIGGIFFGLAIYTAIPLFIRP
jgi:hypothetical protein